MHRLRQAECRAAMRNAARRVCRGQGQTDLPAQQPTPGTGTRFPAADAYPRGTGHRLRPAPQRPARADCLSTDSRPVLPARHRMRRPADFRATVRCGRRAAQSDIVVHSRTVHVTAAGITPEPVVGLIIAKSVGSAVQRHRVARRLRHVAGGLLAELEPTEQVVIRALPGSSRVPSAVLQRQLRAGLRATRRSAGATR